MSPSVVITILLGIGAVGASLVAIRLLEANPAETPDEPGSSNIFEKY